jgi:hypothetical protein
VLAVKAVQEKTSVLVAQGKQEMEAAAVEKKKRRRRSATPSVQELRSQPLEKKKWHDIKAVQKAEVACVESMRKENATLRSTVKKKDTAVAISQQKKTVIGVPHVNTHVVRIKDVKLEVDEGVVEERVEL